MSRDWKPVPGNFLDEHDARRAAFHAVWPGALATCTAARSSGWSPSTLSGPGGRTPSLCSSGAVGVAAARPRFERSELVFLVGWQCGVRSG